MNRDRTDTADVKCAHCGRAITRKGDVLVVGRGLHPLHSGCLDGFQAGQSWFLRSAPINRWRGWINLNALVIGTLGLSLALGIPKERLMQALPLVLVMNLGLLVPRVLAWWTVERHLR